MSEVTGEAATQPELIVPPDYAYLEKLGPSDLELELRKLVGIRPEDMTDDQIAFACAIHRIAARTTAGPPKAKPTSEARAAKIKDAGDLANDF